MVINKNNKYIVDELRYNLGYYNISDIFYGGIAIDIGSNNGCFLEKYKDKFQNIHAYEPNIFLYNLLNNKYKNQNNIKIFNEAVDKTSDNFVKLVKHKYTDDNGSFAILNSYEVNEWDENEIICECKTVNFDKILERAGGSINVLKVDCENSEYNFLFNKNLSSVKLITIEIHHQLGEEKYHKLINHISLTHFSENIDYEKGCNQEFTFINKNAL